jgi:predicted DNA-binding transcriptional regulator YafY
MRASRLLSILMTLQARGRVTAQILADECEVSLRTIYRDIDALSAAGVPVYSDRGSSGGYRLLDGYRTRLNGLSIDEVKALFLSGLSGPAAALGLGSVMAGAQLKLTAALPAEIRSAAERMRACFHLDAPGWFHEPEQPDHLEQIATAVWQQRPIEMRYRSWKAEKQRRVAPLGIVLKSGAWYLVGSVDAGIRTYRVSRVRELTILNDAFERPSDFDLAAYWSDSTADPARLQDAGAADHALRALPHGDRRGGRRGLPHGGAAGRLAVAGDQRIAAVRRRGGSRCSARAEGQDRRDHRPPA